MISVGIDVGREHHLTAVVVVERPTEDGPAFVRIVRTMSKTPFPEQMETIIEILEARNPDVVVVDATPMGMHMRDLLQRRYGGSVIGLNFTDREKAEMIGAVYDLYTGGNLKVPDKYRIVLEELAAIRKEITEAGRTVYRDTPHGDVGWATLLAAYGLAKRVPFGAVHPPVFEKLEQTASGPRGGDYPSLWCGRCQVWTDPMGHQHKEPSP
jgi:phage FluMu gp28-like protein